MCLRLHAWGGGQELHLCVSLRREPVPCVQTHTHTHIHKLSHTFAQTQVHSHIHTLTYSYTHIHTRSHTHIPTLTYSHIHSYTLTFTHLYILSHKLTHRDTHAQLFCASPSDKQHQTMMPRKQGKAICCYLRHFQAMLHLEDKLKRCFNWIPRGQQKNSYQMNQLLSFQKYEL